MHIHTVCLLRDATHASVCGGGVKTVEELLQRLRFLVDLCCPGCVCVCVCVDVCVRVCVRVCVVRMPVLGAPPSAVNSVMTLSGVDPALAHPPSRFTSPSLLRPDVLSALRLAVAHANDIAPGAGVAQVSGAVCYGAVAVHRTCRCHVSVHGGFVSLS